LGRHGVEQLLGVAADATDKRLPEVARAYVAALGAQLRMLKAQILQFDRMITAWHRSSQASRWLDDIPGVGPALGGRSSALERSAGFSPLRMRKIDMAGRAPAPRQRRSLNAVARTIPVDVHDTLGLLAAGRASEYLSLVPEVTKIVIGRAYCRGGELAAIRAGWWSIICARTWQLPLLILHVSRPR